MRLYPILLFVLTISVGTSCAKGTLETEDDATATGGSGNVGGSGAGGDKAMSSSTGATGGAGGSSSSGGMAGGGGLGATGGMGGQAATSGSGGSLSGELTINGDFEMGNTTGWTSLAAENNGSFAATMAQVKTGSWSGNLVAQIQKPGDPMSFPLVKQANLGGGIIFPNSALTISFDMYGTLAGSGGVVFVEVISEQVGGGTSKTEILGGGPLLPNAPNDWTAGWVNYQFNTTVGSNVTGGVTLLFKADCGASTNCTVNVYLDNVSVSVPG